MRVHFAAICGSNMSAEKQLDAAQKFLRGITSLASYAEVREKQALGVQRSLEKVAAFTVAQAATWLGALQEELWSTAQVATFREIVAQKARPVEADNSKAATQDFTLLPFYLTDELGQDIGNPAVDSDRLLYRLCQHAAKMSLRNASEATKATLVVMSKWIACNRGLTPKEQYELYCRHKPLVTKYLVGVASGKYLLDLPLDSQDLDEGIRTRVFPTGKPQQCAMAQDIRDYVCHMPLRKDNRLLVGDTQVVSASRVSGGGGMAVEDFCKVLEACSKTLQPHHERMQSCPLNSSNANGTSGESQASLLAICDRPRAEEEVVTLPKEEEQSQPKPLTMTVEDQLAALRQDLPPSAGLKRPAASLPSAKVPKAKGRPRKVCPGQVPSKQGAVKKVLKRPAAAQAAAVVPGPATSRGAGSRKSSAVSTRDTRTPALSRAERRERVMALVPRAKRQEYKGGCAKCRFTAGCTPSCWRERGYQV